MAVQNKKIENLAKALAVLDGEKEMQNFLTDLCTPQELDSMAERWEIAKLLNAAQLSYREISAQTGASTATITRVGRFLKQEQHHGYKNALERA